jgi:neutral ceramidase
MAAVILWAFGCSPLDHSHNAAGTELRIGAAETDITPPVGYRMAGYFDERLATGIHDPLKAKAVVIADGREKLVLVFCDLLGVSLNVTTNARAQASRRLGIPRSHIMICATHSHTGPLFDDVRRDQFHKTAVLKDGKDRTEPIYYPDFLSEKLVQVISEAHSKLKPAELSVGISKQEGLSFNRRYWMKDGKVVFNPGQLNTNIVRAAGPDDPALGIYLARDASTHEPFAGITVFAMHSDTAGGTEYSADYEYYLEQTLRNHFGGNFISAFGAGTCGDLNHINVWKKDTTKGFAMSERLGRTLGETVVGSINLLTPVSKPALAVRSKTLQIPLQEVTPEQVANARDIAEHLGDPKKDFMSKVVAVKTMDLAERGANWPMEVQVFRIDSENAIVCLPAEIFVELGLAIKKASPFKNTVVISICNDRPSYIPTKKAFIEGSYEVTNSRVKPGAGELLVETAIKLLRELRP